MAGTPRITNNIIHLIASNNLYYGNPIFWRIFSDLEIGMLVCRMDEIALVGTSVEGSSKSVNLDGLRRMSLKHIEAFISTFSDPQALAAAASASTSPAALLQVLDSARIQEAAHLRCRSLSLSPSLSISLSTIIAFSHWFVF